MRSVRIAVTGGADVLKLEDLPLPTLKASEVLVKLAYAGVNYIDTYYRTGLYKKPLPFTGGDEGAGAVVSVGEDVSADLVGKRVAFVRSSGSYSTMAVAQAKDIFEIPEGVTDQVGAATLLQGCTAHYLTQDSYKVQSGDIVLVHAAAGGTGLLVSQMCKNAGATVIGTAGSQDKVELAKGLGRCDHVINYAETTDWASAVKEIAPKGVKVVYDGVGKATFEKGLDVLQPRGYMISFGNASGAVEPIAPLALASRGSLYLQRPRLADYSENMPERVSDVFSWIANGSLKVHVGTEFSLTDASKAHEFLESRGSTGKVILNCNI